MEVTSPGALPNGMTVEKMKGGQQTPRNTNIVRILRDYGMMDDRGMGIRRKVIPLMHEHNGCEPEFEAAEDYFRVSLRRRAGSRPTALEGRERRHPVPRRPWRGARRDRQAARTGRDAVTPIPVAR